jgi:hypothetical protein
VCRSVMTVERPVEDMSPGHTIDCADITRNRPVRPKLVDRRKKPKEPGAFR